MKNQYVGDINDYCKYGILRRLAQGTRLPLAVCWMLTPDDGRTDGRFVRYLEDPERWRPCDPPLYDTLRAIVGNNGERHVRRIEASGILPGARFHAALVPLAPAERAAYFRALVRATPAGSLLFFDPDNGLEVRSVRRGSRPAVKYLYWDELAAAYGAGHSVLVYQHFPRVARAPFLERLAAEMRRRCGGKEVLTFQTSRTAFLLLPRSPAESGLRRAAREIAGAWAGVVKGGRDAARSASMSSSGCPRKTDRRVA